MKGFIGIRNNSGCRVLVINRAGRKRDLPLRLDWANHSPTGFEWGYAGSGPAQLALAMLGEVFLKSQAMRLYQKFKFDKIVHLPRDGWTLNEYEILSWYELLNAAR